MHSPTIWASIAALFLTNLQIVFGQNSQCDQTFNTFFNCMSQKVSVPQTFQSIEQEFDDGHSTLIEKCFASNSAAAQSKKQCLLDRSTIETDVLGPDGPLRGCNFCQKIAKVVNDKYFQATTEQRQCLRKSILQTAVEEIQPCMQNKLHDFSFRIPAIPDLDSASDNYLDLVSPSCQSRYNELQRIACACLNEKSQEMNSKVDQLRDAIMSSTSTSECTRRVDAAAGTWKNKLLDALKECFKGDQQGLSKIPASKMVEIGCLRATQLNESGKKQLAIGFRFLRNFLDVMQDRATRFCVCQ
ncbi:hypothetical protein TTRE_0000303301 [Trichuris trichiura]|uniref:Uncharacterized protein n=1 Tax=Trichuris trichiura TaxID=36087 RepID=A0A077Z544_TRITR|nr:hypothetical protein TTRE_0000303301 [Trichuris trichiura]